SAPGGPGNPPNADRRDHGRRDEPQGQGPVRGRSRRLPHETARCQTLHRGRGVIDGGRAGRRLNPEVARPGRRSAGATLELVEAINSLWTSVQGDTVDVESQPPGD